MPKEFETKRVLVTGAASGIGQAQAIAFAEQGAEVIGIDLDETGLKQTAALVDPDSAKSFTYFVFSLICASHDETNCEKQRPN